MESKKYFLGLDIGTNSVGWTVTDETYNIVKKNGKSLWGVRMFDEAQSAKERRGYRTLRKNIDRRGTRIDLLQMLFAEEIYKVDPTFYKRLDESFYHIEDRQNKNKYTLFNDGWSDYDYFTKFPTIYHLRKELIEKDQKADIRLIYLALSQMMKKRGHFLNDSDGYKPSDLYDLKEYFSILEENLNIFFENCVPDMIESKSFRFEVDNIFLKKLQDIYYDKDGANVKKKKLNEFLNTSNDKIFKDVFVPFLLGTTINIKSIEILGLEEKETLDVNMEDFDDKIEDLKSKIDFPELIEIFISAKKIYDFFYLGKLLSDSKTLYQAMIKRYNSHKSDLKLLKKFIKDYCASKYSLCFKKIDEKGKLHNYPKYIGMNKINNQIKRFGKCTKADFYKFLKANILVDYIKNDISDEMMREINHRMQEGTFLNKLATVENSLFPHQLNLMELRLILENQEKYYPFLSRVEDGMSISRKIELIFTHRIPYYVGPLNKQSPNAWVVRSNEKIYPWNFENIVDLPASAEAFIKRMLNKCTYLKDCYCIAKNSILFSKYHVYSYINKIYINGLPINYEQKMGLFQNIFLKNRKPTKKDLLKYFQTQDKEVIITTSTDKELENLTCSMASYFDFSKIFGESFVNDNIEIIDRLIEDITIFKDKKILEKRILSEPQYEFFRNSISKIKSLNYDGFASVSKELLYDLKYENEHRLSLSIIEIMEQTNLNLMQIIHSDEFQFNKKIMEYNENRIVDTKNVENFIESEVYVSPVMKRSLLQAYKIIEEIEEILSVPISEYYIECARTNNAKKDRTTSRKDDVLNLLDEARKIAQERSFTADINQLKESCQNLDESKFRSDKYYLYFTQLGRCMYSLEKIDFHRLDDDTLYDIDHIVPQALIKDDALSNRVLVKREKNSIKTDNYPIPDGVLNQNCSSFYQMLKKFQMITDKKFSNLTRKELSDSDINRFVDRQMVVTNQAVKGLVEVLSLFKKVDKQKIIFSKAENVSMLRQKYNLVKSRTANNFHHAHDAYLNIIVGRAVHTYFSKYNVHNIADLKFYKQKGITTNPEKIFDLDRPVKMKNIEKFWSKDILGKIRKNIYNRFDILTTTRAYYANELLSKVTIKSASKSDSLFSVKESNTILSQTDKYGGFSDLKFSGYALIKYNDKKNKKIYQIVAIPRQFINHIDEYIKNNVEGSNIEIIIDKLKINTVILRGKRKFCITGKTGDSYVLKNLHERIFNKESIEVISIIDKYNKQLSNKINMLNRGENEIVVSPARSKKNEEIIIRKFELEFLFEEIIKIFKKGIYTYSVISNTIVDKLDNKVFESFSIENQINCLNELLGLLKCNERATANLKIFDLPQKTGTLTMASKLEPNDKIIYESITGFYSKVAWEYK